MSPQDLSDYWNELHSRQSDWAFRANARLIGTLSEDVQEKLRLKEEGAEPYVVVFGKTQVGKTTLLLDLMGIDQARMRTISQVMRGGREQGKSATATAMEYCSSANEQWGLSIQSKPRWFDTDEEITLALGDLREQMESDRLIADAPCVVHIPQRFFGTANVAAPKVRILDLPGDTPANEEEQKHVNQIAKTYLPFADLILLVGRGDDLGFLRPNVITLPGIEDWQAMPHRFRIVTTYSYTAQSVKDILRNDAKADARVLRRRLIQEIERFGHMSDVAKNEDLYFPLEFGTSWTSVQKHDPMLHQRMSPIITRLRHQLLAEIATATTPMGRLRSTLNTHLSVKYIQKKKIEVAEAEFFQLTASEKIILSELAFWEHKIERAQEKVQEIDEILKRHTLENGRHLIKQAADRPRYTPANAYPPKHRNNEKNCRTLKELVGNYSQVLQGMWLDVKPDQNDSHRDTYWIQVRKNVDELNSDTVRNILDNAFAPIRSTLAGYYIDKYFFDDSYNKDYASVFEAGEAAEKKLRLAWQEAWLTALKKVDKEHKEEQKAARTELSISTEERSRSVAQMELMTKEISANEAERQRIVRTSKEDLERCERFVHLLDEEYLEELRGRMNTVYDTDDECESLLQLFWCVELKNQREELMELNNTSMD